MKIPLYYLLFLLILLGCKNSDKLTFEPLVYTTNDCADCPIISISIPEVVERTKLAQTINTALNDEVRTLLLFDDEIEVSTTDEAINTFKNNYTATKKRYADETTAWEANINGAVTYEDKNIVTIALKSYIFTGGAHGYNSVRFLNFDKKKRHQLEHWELLKNKTEFESFVETIFRAQEKIPIEAAINSTGFMFENNTFYLPENIGFTEGGLQLVYNQYEVASYADGPIVITLPYEEVKNYLPLK